MREATVAHDLDESLAVASDRLDHILLQIDPRPTTICRAVPHLAELRPSGFDDGVTDDIHRAVVVAGLYLQRHALITDHIGLQQCQVTLYIDIVASKLTRAVAHQHKIGAKLAVRAAAGRSEVSK